MEKSTRTKKIMFFMPFFGGGGGERIVSHLSLYMPETVQKVIVAFEGQAHYPYQGKTILLKIFLPKNPFFKAIAFLRGYFALRKVILQENPDYVVSLGSITSIINLFTSNKAVVRIGNPITKGHERWLEKAYPLLVRLCFNRAKKIIAISQGSREELVKNFGVKRNKITVIYNFIDVSKTRDLAQEPLEAVHQEIFRYPVVINIANFVEQKGQEYLLKAFKLVKATIKDAKLVFIGKGPLEAELIKMAQVLGIEKDVHFLGWQKNPFKFLAKSRVFALSSLWEGFGIVILEAMACDIPVVAFDCQFGPKEVLAPELDIAVPVKEVVYASCGVLVPLSQTSYLCNQHEDFSKALVAVLDDENLRQTIIHASAKRVQYFNKERFLQGYRFLWH